MTDNKASQYQDNSLPRIQVTRSMVNIFTMQVCAVDDATDEEILKVCNRENPAGTTNGWSTVIRKPDGSFGREGNKAPVSCDTMKGRIHFLVEC